MSDPSTPYPEVDPKPFFPEIENRVLESWAENQTFAQSVTERPAGTNGDNEYVFYDGPPFANGLPHHGHLLTGYVKDVIPRFHTMRGRRVERRFGWDCHGLPAEMQAEKELSVSGRAAIADYGIDRFNDYCRQSVLRYTQEWESTVTRQARWVDFADDYKTMDLPYMESVMWAFKSLWEKGLVYEAYRVMPYSWAAETPLSNFEIRLDDATRPRQDPAITVAFDLVPEAGDPGPMRILAWTTTPWTLPSNLMLIVGPEIDYAVVEHDGGHVVLAAATLEAYAAELGEGRVVGTVAGAELVGRRYRPLFDYFASLDSDGAFQVLGADFVDTAEGTGVVHAAPGFGEDDQQAAEAHGLPTVVPVDDQGRFTDEVADWAGVNVFEANSGIIARLKEQGRILRHATYEHNYPHCWRTDEPIIYRALSSWFVRVTEIRDKMLALNQQINWVPGHVRDGRFGNWLEGARDWSISRNRFWGSPIPVWRSDNPAYPRVDVYGSLDEIERDFGVRPVDLHRPFIDELTRPNPDDPTGESVMRRVPEVLDCWFESGSMPFAQVHYPFENKEWFEHHFPADFIVEYIPQTRGWFYTLHVLASALFDRPAFSNVICHGILLDAKGRKLSKKLRNYTEPEEIFATKGADALRWYLVGSPIVRGGDLRLDDSGIDDVLRQVIIPIWNAYYFFALYANADGIRAKPRASSEELLDRYILAKTRLLTESVTSHMDAYDLPGAAAELEGFIDSLNNWYIRRSRDRFWAPARPSSADDKQDAYDTLFTVLTTLARLLAPFLPLVSEEIYRGLTGESSVHLCDWPDPAELPAEPQLVAAMDRVRDVCSTGLRVREDEGIRVRQPLLSLTVAGTGVDDLESFIPLIAEEVNVKEVLFSDDLTAYGQFVLRPNGQELGPRLGKDAQEVFTAAREGQWEANPDGTVTVAGHTLSDNEFQLALNPVEGTTAAALRTNDALVALDTAVSAELATEGIARDVVRAIQAERKNQDLDVTDRIELSITADAEIIEAVQAHLNYVCEQVLAVGQPQLIDADPESETPTDLSIDAGRLAVRLAKAESQ
ncbi:MAG: isoleucine--tRNA ligase [Acidimicrobiia bacterium]|nr:isoleucine--tRNA ligase [Acidimicrobiia bacterium]MXZ87148.1 isoleucine--tRNA ligase [Acidimicrobiia bacterium]MYG73574.1 isoleucine--tRNA ligase [Acidimicrobiia bacterium]MYI00954.1 isoleucine--tRNA ligase [Acidimicrobiia bacterium]